ncbi:MAG: hypothetical protein IPK68_09080 [Bdellovibrionales bacterium]|nr:hypothetical protein [Bdellovibrionales bacterium]
MSQKNPTDVQAPQHLLDVSRPRLNPISQYESFSEAALDDKSKRNSYLSSATKDKSEVKMRYLIFMLLLGLPGATLACENTPSTLDSVYKCLLENHPSLQYLKFRDSEYQARDRAARQIPNPEIEAKSSVSGESELELEIRQPIEIGGRRSARKEQAQAENNLALADDGLKSGEIALSIAQNLTRLRQLERNLSIILEAKSSTTNITKRLQTKGSLTPEDGIVMGLLRLYESTLIQKARLAEAERDSLKLVIESTAKVSLSGITWTSEQMKRKWPKLSPLNGSVPLQVRGAQAELEIAQAQSHQATAEAWPLLSVGPTFKRISETRQDSWGLMLNMTLPLWHLNGGERALTRARTQQSETRLAATHTLESSRLESLRRTYEKAILALESAPQANSINSLISSTEKQLSRGLIQPNALIEIYRSSLESLEVTNETELQALQAYFQYETAIGHLPKELL